MQNRLLFGLDCIFAFYGGFWAGLLILSALPLNYNFWQWLWAFSIIAIFLFPLIRKIVEVLSEMSWEDFKYAFKQNYKNRAKKRWEYKGVIK